MASIRKTKKLIKSDPVSSIFLRHARFWLDDAVHYNNEYRGISRMLADFDMNMISNRLKINSNKIYKYIIWTA